MKISMVNAITMSTTTDPSPENHHQYLTNVNNPIQAHEGKFMVEGEGGRKGGTKGNGSEWGGE